MRREAFKELKPAGAFKELRHEDITKMREALSRVKTAGLSSLRVVKTPLLPCSC